ncbi:MAG: hypothetical protein ABIN18_19340 [Pseudomonadota bacterium]
MFHGFRRRIDGHCTGSVVEINPTIATNIHLQHGKTAADIGMNAFKSGKDGFLLIGHCFPAQSTLKTLKLFHTPKMKSTTGHPSSPMKAMRSIFG